MIKELNNYFIEASAGTGKTYTIVESLKELVKQIDLEQILIVTYTEKAAGELKYRIRKEISSEKESEVYTIHSFCQKIAQKFPISTNQPLSLEVIDETEVIDFIDCYLRDEPIYEDIIKTKSILNSFSVDNLKTYFVEVLAVYYLDYNYQSCSEIISIDKDSKYDLNLIRDIYDSPNFEDLATKNKEISFICETFSKTTNLKIKELFTNVKSYYQEKKIISFDGKKYRVNKNFSDQEREAFEILKKYKQLFDANKIYNGFICTYIDDIYQKWQEEKRRRKVQTFSDMVRSIREEICNNNELKEKIKNKYKLAIIDEFQDTNQIQWDIFRRVFLDDDEHHIIVVGDPKQSIFSFQGADVNVYNKAIEYIEAHGGKRLCLSTNYRSTPGMIEACNQMFTNDNFIPSFVPSFAPNEKNRKALKATFDGEEIKSIWVVTSDNSVCTPLEFARTAVNKIVEMCSYTDTGTRLKLHFQKEGKEHVCNVSFKDFCILARSKSEMRVIERELIKNGVPYIKNKDDKLFSGLECKQLITILQAINKEDFTEKNRFAFKKSLFTKFFCKSIKEIHNEKYERDDIYEMELLNAWQQLAKEQKWETLIDSLISDSNLEKIMGNLENLQSLSIFKQLCGYACDFLTNHSLDDLIRHLKSKQKDIDIDEEQANGVVEKGTDFDAVTIMTMHSSKGLQFPVVFSVSGFASVYQGNKTVIYHRNNLPVISFEKSLGEAERVKECKNLYYVDYTRAEYLLVLPFYDTAKGYEFVHENTQYFINNKKDYYLNVNVCNSQGLKTKVNEILRMNSKTSDKKTDEIERANQNLVLKELIKSKNKKNTFKHSYTSLSHKEMVTDITVDDTEYQDKEGEISDYIGSFDLFAKVVRCDYLPVCPINISTNYPRGAKIGTALHAVFEKYDYTNTSDVDLEKVIISSFTEQGIDQSLEWINDTKALVREVLGALLPVIHGNIAVNDYILLSNIENNNKKVEAEFLFNSQNSDVLRHYCNGFIDLIFKNGEYYSIVDWKSDTINETDLLAYNNENIKNHVDNCYAIQRVLYSYTLIKWLKDIYINESYEEIFTNHFGGIYYVFLRGCNKGTGNGIYAQTWNSYDDLEKAYIKITHAKMH